MIIAYTPQGIKVGFVGTDIANKTFTFIDEGKGTFSVSNLYAIGLALIKVLEKSAETKNQYIFVSSFETNQKQLLETVEKVSGEKWAVKHITSKELIESGNEKLKKQDFSGVVDLIRAAAFGQDNLGDSTPAGLWNDKLGLRKEDYEASVKAALSGKLVGEK